MHRLFECNEGKGMLTGAGWGNVRLVWHLPVRFGRGW